MNRLLDVYLEVGDMVTDNGPRAWSFTGSQTRYGVIVQEQHSSRALNRMFKILWQDGTIGNNVWDYDLKRVEDEDR